MPLDKIACPDECDFKKKKNCSIIMIPPPDNPRIMLISRDPTEDFVPIYEYSQGFKPEDMRKMLFATAIPYSLITKIRRFMENQLKPMDKPNLFKLFECAYWTHLHKCPTSRKESPFKKKNGTACANKWLTKEIREGIRDGVGTIICLGSDVRKWIKKSGNVKMDHVRIIELPHPSNRNVIWYSRNQNILDEINKELKELLNLLHEIKCE